MFQSSPGLGAGCCGDAMQHRHVGSVSSNPHPAWGPGAASSNGETTPPGTFQSSPGLGAGCCRKEPIDQTSPNLFLSSPGFWAGGCDFVPALPMFVMVVPILTRLGGRVLRQHLSNRRGGAMFQSSPGLGAGCCGAHSEARLGNIAFQSSPGLGAGCCRAQSLIVAATEEFQSSPGLGAGCCR